MHSKTIVITGASDGSAPRPTASCTTTATGNREVAPQRTIDVHDAGLSPTRTMLYEKIVTTLTTPASSHLAIDEATDA